MITKVVIGDLYTDILGILPCHVDEALNAYLTFKYEEQELGRLITKYECFLFRKDSGYYVYTGLLPYVNIFFQKYNINPFDIKDQRIKSKELNLEYRVDPKCIEGITLRDDYQVPVVETVLRKRKGIIHIPTRGGKTEVMLGIIASYLQKEKPKAKITFIAKDNNLVSNFCGRLEKRGFTDYSVLNASGCDPNVSILCCVVNSFYNKVIKSEEVGEIEKRLLDTDVLLLDECHNLPGNMFHSSFIELCKVHHPSIVACFSGTPFINHIEPYTHPRDVLLIGLTNGIIYNLDNQYLIDNKYKAQANVVWLEPKTKSSSYEYKSYSKVYENFITNNMYRNIMACEAIEKIVSNGFRCLVLVDRIEHGETILKLLSNCGGGVKFKSGTSGIKVMEDGMMVELKANNYDIVEDFNKDNFSVLIGTSIFNTGTDFPGCNWLVLLSGGGGDNDILNMQRTSRVLCFCGYDNNGYIVDFIDSSHKYTSSQSRNRNKFYKRNGYNIKFGSEALDKVLLNSKILKGNINN